MKPSPSSLRTVITRQTPAERAEWRHRLSSSGFTAALFVSAVMLGTGTAQAQRPLGVDVSDDQGSSINWSEVKSNGVSFAWSKATEGASGQYVSQASFTGNETRGKSAGVFMGAYHFAHPSENAPGSEASYFWSVAGSYILADGKTLMPMLDMESLSTSVGAANLSDWASDWCADIVADAAANAVSVKPAIYVSACNACDFNTSVAQWGDDIANYNGENVFTGTPWSSCTSCEEWGSGVWNFWQVSDTGAIGGISGHVDLDGFNGTAATLLSTWVATAAASSIYYWDPQGTSGANPYTGSMTGTWENNSWSTGSGGQASPTGWVNGKAACFGVHTGSGTPSFTVTMNSSHVVAGFFDGPLAPNSCNVTITGSGVITLASGAQGCDVHNASDGSDAYITINNVIAGDGQLVPEDDGQIFLNGANTYTGGTQLGYTSNPFTGLLNFNNGSSFGTGTITLSSLGNGGALVAEGTAAITIPNAVSVTSATTNNFVGTTSGVTYSGNWSLGGNLLTFETGNTAGKIDIISGVVSGTAGLTVSDSGTLELTGVNTYSGTTTIVSPCVFTIGGAGQLNSGAYANSVVNGGTFNYNSTASQTLSGVISGAGPLKQNAAGLLVLTGVNTYSGGTTVSGGGTLSITADSGLGTAAGALTLNGGCLKNNNSAPTLNSSRTITLGASGGYFDAGWAPSEPITISSKLTGSGALFINLDGSPVVLANTGNNYTGNTIIGTNGPGYYSAGTQAWLKLGASGVIPNGSGNGNVFIYQAYDGLLDLAGFTQTINGLNGDGTVNNSTGNGSLSVGNNNQTSTFNGVIENSAGTLALTKIGSGALILGGANTYTGNTAVNAGTLALSGGSIGASTVTVASTATLANSTTNTGPIGGTTTLNSGAFATFTGVGGSPSVIGKISVTGNLNLNGNALTINVSGAALAAGAYRLLDCTGTLSGSANSTPTISGIPLAGGYTAYISTTSGAAGHVDLVVQGTAPLFSNLIVNPSATYGMTSVLLGGTVTAPGPVYPSNGETITVTINGNTQPTIINDGTGDFSISYNLSALPVSGTPYTITYSYGGDGSLSAASSTNTALTFGPLPVALTGARPYDGTTTAAAGILTVTNKVGGDVVTVASGIGTLASANAGTNTISSLGTLALGGAAAGNYTLAGSSGLVTVGQVPLSITANPQTITYGASVPGTTVTYSGFVNSETNTALTTQPSLASAQSGVVAAATYAGNYTASGAVATNYNISYVAGTLTVNPLPVNLTGSRPYDGANDANSSILTITNNLDSTNLTLSGSALLTSANVGPEAITSFGTLALGGTAATNYTLTNASGLVTITTPPFSIMSASVDVSGTNFIITWQSAPGATYHVVGSTNPTTALSNWPTVAGPIIATDTNTSVTNPIGSPMSIYDVISP